MVKARLPFSGILTLLACFAPLAKAAQFDWPQWRGPDRTGVSKETGLLKSWPEGGPKQVWRFENAGEGYSGPAIAKGQLLTMGSRDGSEGLLALEGETGKELWFTPVSSIFKEGHGNGPRGTPTVDGDLVYAMSSLGTVVCANVSDGKIVWQQTMKDLGGRTPNWGYTESVLVDGEKVVCTPGGSKGTVAALDKTTGKVLWQSADFTDPAHYSSIVPVEMNGTRQYIQRTMSSIAGVSATDGKLLWKSGFPGRTAVVPTPIYKDNHVYVAAGYGVGCKLVKISPNNEASDVYENKVMKNHHGGVILVGDFVYGYSDGGGWLCQNFLTGEEVWSERKALGKGAIAFADNKFYCLDESSGTLVLIDASPAGWKEHGRFKPAPESKLRTGGARVWTHPVISNGKLYLRDQEMIYCYDLKLGTRS